MSGNTRNPLRIALLLAAVAPAALAQETVLSRTWVREKAGPTTFADSFAVCDPAGRFTLVVENGPGGAAAISSATIAVNGADVVRPSDLNQQVSRIERVLQGIGATNQITARLTSNPGGTLGVSIVGVMSCGLKIKSPSSGSTLTDPEVLVQGTLPLSSGIDVGVRVNGVAAAVAPGRFAALVEVDASTTGLTAVATSPAGAVLSQDSIPVTVQLPAAPPSLRLLASTSGGLSPLRVEFLLATDLKIAQVALDFEGNGSVDFTGASLDGLAFTYAQTGLYLPTVTATDSAGGTHTSTAVVLVSDPASLEAVLQARWGAMKDALRRGDVAAAGQLIIASARQRYVDGFTAMAADLPDIDSILTPIRLERVRGRQAILEMVRTDDGIEKSFEVRCALDEDGIWRLRAF